ncbi:hypothetical protein DIPPA_56682 [Diplonema papillatum]|nr:hypothetical protein DIPPA_56682 [Diplonema papillatum]
MRSLRLQRRWCSKELADNMRRAGIDPTVAFHEERKRFLKEEYHYPDTAAPTDALFNQRLKVYQKVHESQEMDGTCRFLLAKEVEQAEKKIYEMAVRSGKALGANEQVSIVRRVQEARARLTRRYTALDADLRSGDEHLERRARDYLTRVNAGQAANKWDYGRAAHGRYTAELQGSPQAEELEKASNEMDGRPDATASELNVFEEVGFLEKDEFAMLRREVGEELADEFITNLQKTRSEVVRKRLSHVADRARLHSLEKKMVLQEYRTVFDQQLWFSRRQERAHEFVEEAIRDREELDAFENERNLSGAEGLNSATHTMAAEARQKRMDTLKAHREKSAGGEDRSQGAGGPVYWEETVGLIRNPRNFVDPDWWELATESPGTKRSYNEALRRDVRILSKDKSVLDPVVSRQKAADSVLQAMESFNDFRKDNFSKGYPKSQVLPYDDPRHNEPVNHHIEEVLYKELQTGRRLRQHYSEGLKTTWQRWADEESRQPEPPAGTGRHPGLPTVPHM